MAESQAQEDDPPPHLAHAEYWSRHNNIENPELYAIFPCLLWGI
jgi:hypothetical protein